jgi:hypothetical protein
MIITILAIGILVELLLIELLLMLYLGFEDKEDIFNVVWMIFILPFTILFIIAMIILYAVGFFDDESRGEE